MKHTLMKLSAAFVPLAAACIAPVASANEYTRQQNVPKPVPGTHESRSAERKATRAELKTQAKAGALPETGEDWGMNKNKPAPVAGTHESRSAERKVKRSELKATVKAGEMPVTNEAVVNQPRTTP